MITRLEIDGFKTFRAMALDVAPFQAVVGANGAGTSNLLDALVFAAALADGDLATACESVRGGSAAVFSIGADGTQAGRMRICAEMLTEPSVEDRWGMRADVRYTRLRYEVEIEARRGANGAVRLHVAHEELAPIQRSSDPWARRYLARAREHWLPPLRSGRTAPFVSTSAGSRGSTVYLHQDGRGGEMAATAQSAERTALSTVTSTEFPHAFAAREEMRRWRAIALAPAAIRGAGGAVPHSFITDDGGNLTAALVRMNAERPGSLERIARDLALVAPGVAAIALDERAGFYRQQINATLSNGHTLPMAALGDADLRLFALCALANDPDLGGVLALDEPENGLDSAGVRRLARYLVRMSTDLEHADHGETRLRQAIVTTHSTVLIDELARVVADRDETGALAVPSLLFAHRRQEGDASGLSTDSPVVSSDAPTGFTRIRPSRQLTLALAAGDTVEDACTIIDVEAALAGRSPAW